MTILESIGLPTKSYDFCFQGGGGGIGDGVGDRVGDGINVIGRKNILPLLSILPATTT